MVDEKTYEEQKANSFYLDRWEKTENDKGEAVFRNEPLGLTVIRKNLSEEEQKRLWDLHEQKLNQL